MNFDKNLTEAIDLLNRHYADFQEMVVVARRTGHPVPMDTRGWSQILVSVLTGIRGLDRKKGADLADGSDVKGANTWEAIDTPRFNGVIKSGTKGTGSDSLASLDAMPHLFFVMWDETNGQARCRIWCVRPQADEAFRSMCQDWYGAKAGGKIGSNNFQLHPPRGRDDNEIRNTFGNLHYPLLLCAVRRDDRYEVRDFDPNVLTSGVCRPGEGLAVATVLQAAADPGPPL